MKTERRLPVNAPWLGDIKIPLVDRDRPEEQRLLEPRWTMRQTGGRAILDNFCLAQAMRGMIHRCPKQGADGHV